MRAIAIVTAISVSFLLTAVACGPSEEVQQDAALDQAWTDLTQAKEDIDSKRAALAALAEKIAAAKDSDPAEAEPVEGEPVEGEPGLEDLQVQYSQGESEIQALADDLGSKIVDFLNADPMLEGEPPNERQLAAIRLKSDEEMLLAQEYIDRGGDFRRAIDIYNQALAIDPDNEKLKAALSAAEVARYMTEERFASIKKRMTQDEVREALGPVNLHNIREYPDRNVVAWFYPREGSGAAAVYFQSKKKDGEYLVYKTDFNAVKAKEEAAE